MSVTFSLDMELPIVDPFRMAPDGLDPSDSEIDAYFAARAAWGEFNVANGNAGYILRDVLGLENPEPWGEMSGEELAFRLSMIDQGTAVGGLAPATRAGNVVNCGRSLDQCERYIDNLLKLSRLCAEHGCGITWG